jgi:hypothetical protein
VLLTCAGATLVSAVVVVAAGAEVGGGFAVELLGVIAAIAAIALVAWAARARASGA